MTKHGHRTAVVMLAIFLVAMLWYFIPWNYSFGTASLRVRDVLYSNSRFLIIAESLNTSQSFDSHTMFATDVSGYCLVQDAGTACFAGDLVGPLWKIDARVPSLSLDAGVGFSSEEDALLESRRMFADSQGNIVRLRAQSDKAMAAWETISKTPASGDWRVVSSVPADGYALARGQLKVLEYPSSGALLFGTQNGQFGFFDTWTLTERQDVWLRGVAKTIGTIEHFSNLRILISSDQELVAVFPNPIYNAGVNRDYTTFIFDGVEYQRGKTALLFDKRSGKCTVLSRDARPGPFHEYFTPTSIIRRGEQILFLDYTGDRYSIVSLTGEVIASVAILGFAQVRPAHIFMESGIPIVRIVRTNTVFKDGDAYDEIFAAEWNYESGQVLVKEIPLVSRFHKQANRFVADDAIPVHQGKN